MSHVGVGSVFVSNLGVGADVLQRAKYGLGDCGTDGEDVALSKT